MTEKKYIALNLAKAQFTGNFIDIYPPSLIKALLDIVPAADVEPVRRGHWIINSDGYYPQCSECMKEPQGRVMTDWCPNCGARMKGEENGK